MQLQSKSNANVVQKWLLVIIGLRLYLNIKELQNVYTVLYTIESVFVL